MPQFEVSFNSPQCGWMSIGFRDEEKEFHTTTACSPYKTSLKQLLEILTSIMRGIRGKFVLNWNRDPEEFDFEFTAFESNLLIEIYQYPTPKKDLSQRKLVYSYLGDIEQVCNAFYRTFRQLYEDREIDEFESNWHHPFPLEEFKEFCKLVEAKR
ncbi:MAG: hypothetical protein N2Z23_10815 [Pyrinomonadaceae bacterium]|nr:hypothetical protein [Pyrinomonadaceae bacterium]MCX7640917.1 hypothetical protein [Pyrinomonadaceae bacterium]MDW8304699.1 hypothetical protein [Acidobacteriota bacterium]